MGQQPVNDTRDGRTTVVVYLAHPLGPIPQGPVLKVLSGSLRVWPDSGGRSGSRGKPDIGSWPDIGRGSGGRGRPDVSSWLASRRWSGSRGRPDVGSWPDSRQESVQTIGTTAWRQPVTARDEGNAARGGGGLVCGTAVGGQLSTREIGKSTSCVTDTQRLGRWARLFLLLGRRWRCRPVWETGTYAGQMRASWKRSICPRF